MASPSEPLSLSKILSESKLIIKAHLHHFQALTFLFLFPFSLCLIIYFTIQTAPLSQSQPDFTLQTLKDFHSILSYTFPNLTESPKPYLLLTLLYTLFTTLLSLCAVGTISYSTYHAFYGEPVNLITSIKSLFKSFLPLLSTIFVLDLIVALTIVPFVLLVLLVYHWLHFSEVENSYNSSSYSTIFLVFITLVYTLSLIYLQVNWILASVIVVVESKWGYEPLQRSAQLVKGNRGVALSMILYYGLINGMIFWSINSIKIKMWNWWFLLSMVLISVCISFILLSSLVANVVLYVYCKHLHEGLPLEETKHSLLK